MSAFDLVVVSPFLGYQRGERIADRETVAKLIDSAWQAHFVKTQPLPQPKPKKK